MDLGTNGSRSRGRHRQGVRRARLVAPLLALALVGVQTQLVLAGNDKAPKEPTTEREIEKECRERKHEQYGQNSQWRAQHCDQQEEQNQGSNGNGNGNGNGKNKDEDKKSEPSGGSNGGNGGSGAGSDNGGSGGGSGGSGGSGGGNGGSGGGHGGNDGSGGDGNGKDSDEQGTSSGGGSGNAGNSGGSNGGGNGGGSGGGSGGTNDELAGDLEEEQQAVEDLTTAKLSGELEGGLASITEIVILAEPDPVLGNQYVEYFFVFSDGHVAQGTCVSLDCVIHPDAGSQLTHLSCSDTFASGFSDAGGFPQPGDPSVVTFFIERYKWSNPLEQYVLFKTCGAQPTAPTLDVTKSAVEDPVDAGDNAQFTIVVTNNGPGIATAVTLMDPLPSGFSWSENSTSCSIADGLLSCDIGDMAQGATFSVTLTTATDGSDCGTHDNIATADGTNTDPAVGSDSVTVTCVPVLVVEKTPDGGTIQAGQTAQFTIKVTNNGPGTATAVTLNDTLPGDMTWTDNSASCSITGGNSLSCSFGDLAQGASASVTVSAATDDSDCGLLDNQDATADASNAAPAMDDGDITVSCDVTVDLDKTNDADGDETFTDSEIAPAEGADVPFQLVIENTSAVAVVITTLTDAIGNGLPTDIVCLSGGQTVIGMILAAAGEAGDSVTCTFTLTNYAPPGGEVLVNTARVIVAEVGDLENTDDDTDTSTVTTLSPEIAVDVQKTNDADEDGSFSDNEEALEEGAPVTFQAVVTNTSSIPVVLTTLTDEFPGTGAFGICADLLGTTLQPGGSVTCTFTLTGYAPPANGSITNTVRTVVVDAEDETRTASDFDPSTVTTPEVLPEIFRRPPPGDVVRPGLLAFTGAPLVVLALLSALLLMAGAGLSALGRRRRREEGSA